MIMRIEEAISPMNTSLQSIEFQSAAPHGEHEKKLTDDLSVSFFMLKIHISPKRRKTSP